MLFANKLYYWKLNVCYSAHLICSLSAILAVGVSGNWRLLHKSLEVISEDKLGMGKKMFYIIRPFIWSFYYMWHNIEKMYTILGSISDKQREEVFINKWRGLRTTIKFYKIDIRNLKTLLIDDIELIQYAGVHIWGFYECTFWYVIQYKQEYYVFDIREIAEQAGLEDPENEVADIMRDQKRWLSNFINKLEAHPYFMDMLSLILDPNGV